jgi:hypothetical protein
MLPLMWFGVPPMMLSIAFSPTGRSRQPEEFA